MSLISGSRENPYKALADALAAIPGLPPSAGVETSAGFKMLGFRLAHTLRYEKGKEGKDTSR